MTTETVSINTCYKLILQHDASKQINSDVQISQGFARITTIRRFTQMCVLPCLELHLLFSAYQKIIVIFWGFENRNNNNNDSHRNNCDIDRENNTKIIVSKQCKGKGLFTVNILRLPSDIQN